MKPNQLYFLPLLFLFFSAKTIAQSGGPLISEDRILQKQWVDSIYNKMTLQEKVGQLFMVDVFSNKTQSNPEKIKKLIREEKIGGIIFSKGGPQRQAKLNNEFQELSEIPLLVGMDAEWGLAMRLDSTFSLPWNMTLGAINDLELIQEAGAAISRNSRRLGVHINFAPVIDINTNPENPIIGSRAFGEEKINVTEKALAFMKGMHSEGILSSAKHFPGHGDTEKDSHKTLPTISFSKQRINEVELYPYRRLIEEGVSSVMVAHLNVPALEKEQNRPSSISKTIVTGILKEELGFEGLIFTDALNMKGASNFKNPGEIDLAAFQAGNDVLLISEDIPVAKAKIQYAYEAGLITEERLEHSVRKILNAKYKVGLHNYQPVDTTNLISDLNNIRDELLYHQLIEDAVTVIKNDMALLPVKDLEISKIAYVNFGDASGSAFLNQLSKYSAVDWVKADTLEVLLNKLQAYNMVIIGYHQPNHSPWSKYKFTEKEQQWIHEIGRQNRTILDIFTKPYALMDLKSTSNFEAVVVSYQNSAVAQEKSAQIIFGALPAKGILPVTVGDNFPAGTGYRTGTLNRLAYGIPESVGMNSEKLKKIDSLIEIALEQKMSPGMQVLVARKGKVIYQRNAGFLTYEKTSPVTDTTLYDVASLTKILASLPMIMKLEEQNVLNFDSQLGDLMPVFKGTNKENIRFQDLLMHYGRLKSWLPLYVPTIDQSTNRPSEKFYRTTSTKGFEIPVANGMFIRNDIRNFILSEIKESGLENRTGYQYSDLPFYMMKYYLEDHFKTSLAYVTQERIYQPLGANFTSYNPLEKFDVNQIAPTEDERLWRRQVVRGYVHDQGAAMQGGVGGHAGLFSNANDVAKIMQLYLNGGNYGGKRYLEEGTVEKFNSCYYCERNVRRGVGFDKPQLGNAGPTCGCVSMKSFGHTGFTGTMAWANPDEKIVYVFLSNRTFPDVDNRKLIRSNIREKIQAAIQEAIDERAYVDPAITVNEK